MATSNYDPRKTPHYYAQGDGSLDVSKLGRCKSCNGFNLPGATTCRHCGAKLS